jgi:hypothetical protein
MILHNLWYIFLKLFKKNPTLVKGDFNPSSFFNRIWISTFSLNQSDNIISFRQKNYPTLHSFHSKRNFVTYKFSLKILHSLFSLIKANTFLNKLFFSENAYLTLILFTFFLKKNFLKFFNLKFFKMINSTNLIKIFILFLLSFTKLKKELILFNLNNHNDWFKYNFDQNFFFFLKKSTLPTHLVKLHTTKKINFFKKTYKYYANYLSMNFNDFLNVWSFIFNKTSLSLIHINHSFKNLTKAYYPIRFNESSSNKFIELEKISDYCFFFIRKNRIFNKGRYSRNRQTYRTGVYWCLWFNILSVYGLYFIFYRFSFNFGYLWLPLIIFFGSFIFSRALKYNFFNINFVVLELKNFTHWSSLLYQNFSINFIKILNFIFSWLSSLYVFSFFKNFEESILIKYIYSNVLTNYFFLIQKNENKFENVWDSLNNSFNKFFLKI